MHDTCMICGPNPGIIHPTASPAIMLLASWAQGRVPPALPPPAAGTVDAAPCFGAA
jgi:hypothetical protein